MIGDTSIYAWIAGGAFALAVVTAIAANVYLKTIKNTPDAVTGKPVTGKPVVIIKAWFFGLFLVTGFALVPLLIGWFTETLSGMLQGAAIAVFLHDNAMWLVYGFWALYAVGMLIAVPAMVKGGFFKGNR